MGSHASGGCAAADAEQAIVDVFDAECILIRNFLTLEEQTRLFEYIQACDKTPTNLPRAMVPAPKTLQIGENGAPSRGYTFGERTVVNAMVEKAAALLQAHGLNVIHGLDVCRYSSLAMAVIQYEAPDGRFPPHVDHCGESFVFLSSLGRDANFMVKGPSMSAQNQFKMSSGDLLVFNASTRAAILHGVLSIAETASAAGETLSTQFPTLQKHRYGVQCRMYLQGGATEIEPEAK